MSNCPNILIETIALMCVVTAAYWVSSINSKAGSFSETVPVIGLFALGLQRMLPYAQQLYSNLVTIRSNHSSVQDAIALMDQPYDLCLENSATPAMPFANELRLNNVSFAFVAKKSVLNDVNICIKMGERIGIVGPTGSGKSTLADILMGLLCPTEGYMTIDGVKVDYSNSRSWQKNIAHVSQNIYLTDASIRENIAYGILPNNIDEDRLQSAASFARVDDFVNGLPDSFDTRVGERGIRLSGGQKQRIGIARAFYKGAKVLVLDEATSALDLATEAEVISSIDDLARDVTLIIIAHRYSTLKSCNRVFEVVNGSVTLRPSLGLS